MQAEVQRVLGAFWDDARLEIIVRTLVLHFFPLTVSSFLHPCGGVYCNLLADWSEDISLRVWPC